jgi:hypothetical protein
MLEPERLTSIARATASNALFIEESEEARGNIPAEPCIDDGEWAELILPA